MITVGHFWVFIAICIGGALHYQILEVAMALNCAKDILRYHGDSLSPGHDQRLSASLEGNVGNLLAALKELIHSPRKYWEGNVGA